MCVCVCIYVYSAQGTFQDEALSPNCTQKGVRGLS